MARLNQIIAVEKGVKTRSHQELTEAHQALQKPALLSGIARTYRPKDEEGEQLPPEATRVQIKSEEILRRTTDILTELFDVTATKDYANCTARADVVVDGKVLLAAVPVTYLLFLEKQLVDLHTFAKKLPVLDASETWAHDASADCWATEPVQTVQDQEGAAEPRQGRGHREAPRSGRGLPRGRHRRLLEDREVLRRAPRSPRQRGASLASRSSSRRSSSPARRPTTRRPTSRRSAARCSRTSSRDRCPCLSGCASLTSPAECKLNLNLSLKGHA